MDEALLRVAVGENEHIAYPRCNSSSLEHTLGRGTRGIKDSCSAFKVVVEIDEKCKPGPAIPPGVINALVAILTQPRTWPMMIGAEEGSAACIAHKGRADITHHAPSMCGLYTLPSSYLYSRHLMLMPASFPPPETCGR